MAKRLRDRLEALEQRLLALEHRLDRSASETPARTRHSPSTAEEAIDP